MSAKRRGRPPLLPPDQALAYQQARPTVSRRTAQNRHYAARAMAVLGLDTAAGCARYPWLVHPRPRPSVLAELGRIGDVEALRTLAAELCAQQPKARAAVARIRRHRVGAPHPKPRVQLANAIVHLLNDRVERDPSITREDLVAALQRVLRAAEALP